MRDSYQGLNDLTIDYKTTSTKSGYYDKDTCSVDHNVNIQMMSQSFPLDEDTSTDYPSNETLLCTAFITFLGFTVLQAFAAIYAGSQAMLGDSAAMAVDALMYAFNLAAEKKKNSADRILLLKLELIPPLISVTALITITIVIMKNAIMTLLNGKPENQEDEPNVSLMFFFSALNLFLDLVNMRCFARAQHVFGFSTVPSNISNNGMNDMLNVLPEKKRYKNASKYGMTSTDEDIIEELRSQAASSKNIESDWEVQKSSTIKVNDKDESQSANLNMCSAYTHVFADTLRSIAVFVAASIAAAVEMVDGEEADSVAAIIVSVIIILSLIPLLTGIIYTFSELQAIYIDEARERLNEEEAHIITEE